MQSLSGEEDEEEIWNMLMSVFSSFYSVVLPIHIIHSASLPADVVQDCYQEKLNRLDIDFDKPPKLIRKNLDDEDGDDWTFAVPCL